jgi:hypothetical protein
MAATIGVSSTLQNLVTPGSGTVINEVTTDESKEVKTIKNSSGVTVQVGVLPMIETKISVKGKGAAALTLAVAGTAGIGSAITSGAVAITSVSVDESNEDYPDFSIEAMKWSNS